MNKNMTYYSQNAQADYLESHKFNNVKFTNFAHTDSMRDPAFIVKTSKAQRLDVEDDVSEIIGHLWKLQNQRFKRQSRKGVAEVQGGFDGIGRFFSLPFETVDVFRNAISVLENVTDPAAVAGAMSSFAKTLKPLEQGISVNVNLVIPSEFQISVALGAFVWFYQFDDYISRSICFGSVVWISNLLLQNVEIRSFVSAFLKKFASLFEPTSDIETQGPISKVLPLVVSLFAGSGIHQILGIAPDLDVHAGLLSRINSFARTISDVKYTNNSFTTILEFVDEMTRLVDQCLGTDWATHFAGEVWVELENVRLEMVEIEKAMVTARGLDYKIIRQKVDKALKTMNSLTIKKISTTKGLYPHVLHRLLNVQNRLRTKGAYAIGHRNEPFVVMVSGPAGTGKSTFSRVLRDSLASVMFSKETFDLICENPDSSIWCPNQVESFDSGYTNQPIVYVDDVGFDSKGNETFIPKLIHMIGDLPLATNQADLVDKGNIFFDSELILGTTNVTDFNSIAPTITHRKALMRRLHVCVHVDLIDEKYRDDEGVLSWAAVDEEIALQASKGVTLLRESCFWLKIKRFNPDGGSVTRWCKCKDANCDHADTITMPELLKSLRDTMLSRRKHSARMAESGAAFRERLRSQPFEDIFATQGWFDWLKLGQVDDLPGVFETCFDPLCVKHRKHDMNKLQQLYIDVTQFESKNKSCCACCGATVGMSFTGLDMSEITCISEEQTFFEVGFEKRKIDTGCRALVADYLKNCIVLHNKEHWSESVITSQRPSFIQKMFEWSKEICYNIGAIISISCRGVYTWIMHDPGYAAMCIGAVAASFFLAHRMLRTKVCQDPVETQTYDANAEELTKSLISHSVVHFMKEGQSLGIGTAIGGELILINRHAFVTGQQIVREYGDFKVHIVRATSPESRFNVVMNASSVYCSDNVHYFIDADVVCLRVEKWNARDITKHFSSVKWNSAVRRQVAIATWKLRDNNVETGTFTGNARGIDRAIPAMDKVTNQVYTTKKCVEYDIATYKGLCGSPVILFDPKATTKIVGIHAAGGSQSRCGYGAIVTPEMIAECVDRFKPKLAVIQSNDFIRQKVFVDRMPPRPVSDCQVIGTCDAVRPHYKSEIGRSPIYGKIACAPPTKCPAILNPRRGENIDPIELNIKQYARGWVQPPAGLFRGCELGLLQHYSSMELPKIKRFLTNEEAVRGCDELPNLKPINRGTSAGFPDKLFLGSKKRDAFGYDDWVFDTPEAKLVFEQVDVMFEQLKSGPITTICSVFPKDELRPKEKVEQLKTRLIMSAPLTMLILTRRCFGPYIDWMITEENRIRNFSAVGINMADSFQCEKYISALGAGDAEKYRVFAGDQSGYDKKLGPYLMDHQFEIIKMAASMCGGMTQEEMTIMENLYYSCTRVCTQVNDNLIYWGNSNPSGWSLTTLTNGTTNVLGTFIACAHAILGPDANWQATKKFVDVCIKNGYIFPIVYGDDITLKVIRGTHDGYNFDLISNESLSCGYSSLGHVYTDETKSTVFSEVDRTVFEVSFLKRTVRYQGNLPVAYLDIETLLQNIQWMKTDHEKDEMLEVWVTKFDGFLTELAVHPDSVWDEWYPRLVDAFNTAALDLPRHLANLALTREERIDVWRSSDLSR